MISMLNQGQLLFAHTKHTSYLIKTWLEPTFNNDKLIVNKVLSRHIHDDRLMLHSKYNKHPLGTECELECWLEWQKSLAGA